MIDPVDDGELIIRIKPGGQASIAIGDTKVGGVQEMKLTLDAKSTVPSLVVTLPWVTGGTSKDLVAYFSSVEERLQGFAPWVTVVRR